MGASRNIFTNIFRVGHPHLAEPNAYDSTQEAKYKLVAMFPKVGVLPSHLGSGDCSINNILGALDEVCTEEWGMNFESAAVQMRVAFPPKWKDGDSDFETDDKGRIIQGQVKPSSVGNWMINLSSIDPVGCVDHTGQNDIDPRQIYGGCWAAAELEVMAYTNKNKANIIAITLINVQKCYDDESFGGGGGPRRAASESFKGRAITNSNCANTGFPVAGGQPAMPGQAPQTGQPAMPGQAPQTGQPAMPGQAPQTGQPAMPGQAPQTGQPAMPGQAPQTGQPAMPGQAPQTGQPAMPGQAPQTGQQYLEPVAPTYQMTAAANGYTREQILQGNPGWTDEHLISGGFMVKTN